MAVPSQQPASLAAVPLFPLPNVVLFPRAVLPLHIVENRYRVMTTDCLAGPRQIAMALLKPGWEKNYYGRPQLEPVVCVGSILTHESLPEGKSNFVVQGHTRARNVREHDHHPYRIAELEPLCEVPAAEVDLLEYRHRLINAFDSGSLLTTVIGRQFRQLLTSPLSTSDIADLIAFNFLGDSRAQAIAPGRVRCAAADFANCRRLRSRPARGLSRRQLLQTSRTSTDY